MPHSEAPSITIALSSISVRNRSIAFAGILYNIRASHRRSFRKGWFTISAGEQPVSLLALVIPGNHHIRDKSNNSSYTPLIDVLDVASKL